MKTGVYRIVNTSNKKFYVGSAQASLNRRKNQHFHLLRKGNHHSIHLQRAWNKYGEKEFRFEIIEECLPEKCIEREQFYLDSLKPEYNIQPNAASRAGTTLSKEHKKKAIKVLNDNRWKLDLPEIRKKMSDYHKGRKKTKEHALLVGAASKKKVLQYNRKGEFIKEWNSIKEVENYYHAVQGTLWKALTNKTKTFRKFIWKYYTPNYSLKIDSTPHNWNYKK
jgi:group I intron endonuclease